MLDTKLIFDEYLKMVSSKINKTIRLPWILQNVLPYKTLARPNLDYGDILYEQIYNMLFHKKLESVQYSARFTINGEIGGTPKDKIYQELGLE